MDAAKTFYTYLWLREDGTPYYVGKGHGKRAIRKGSPKNLDCIIIQEHESESAALFAEKFLIALYGRKDLGTGILRNRTDGGEGTCGCSPSKETRAKLRLLLSGENHPNWQKKLSAETRRRKSEAISGDKHFLKGKKLPESWKANLAAAKVGWRNPYFGKHSPISRKVINVVTEVVYASAIEAAKAEGFVYQTLYNMLAGYRMNHTSLQFAEDQRIAHAAQELKAVAA
jgi:hypothetical protein